jgi:anti-sigma regulatory factor (Ser/Thr protein kinase)
MTIRRHKSPARPTTADDRRWIIVSDVSTLPPQRQTLPAFEVDGGLHAPSLVRRRVTGYLAGALDAGLLHDAELLVSEVVTNAVLHGGASDGSPIGVSVDVLPDRVRVAVTDPGCGFDRPAVPRARADAAGGNGLVLLERLAADWDVESGERNCVWFELERGSRRGREPAPAPTPAAQPVLSLAC